LSNIRKSVKSAFDEIAESYDRLRGRPWKVFVDFVKRENFFGGLLKGSLMLDAGCGNGRHTVFCANLGFRVIGIDISSKLLKIAKQKVVKSNLSRNVALVISDILFLPFKTNIFKKAIFIASLHHIPSSNQRLQCLLELKRVLTKDCEALITVWRRWQASFIGYFLKDFFKRVFRCSNGEFGDIYVSWKIGNKEVQRFYHLFTKRELLKLLNKSNFSIKKISSEDIEKIRIKRNFFVIVKKITSRRVTN